MKLDAWDAVGVVLIALYVASEVHLALQARKRRKRSGSTVEWFRRGGDR